MPAVNAYTIDYNKCPKFQGLKIRKQRSTGDLEKRGAGTGSIRSTGSSASWVSTDSSQSVMTNASLHTDSNASFVVEVMKHCEIFFHSLNTFASSGRTDGRKRHRNVHGGVEERQTHRIRNQRKIWRVTVSYCVWFPLKFANCNSVCSGTRANGSRTRNTAMA